MGRVFSVLVRFCVTTIGVCVFRCAQPLVVHTFYFSEDKIMKKVISLLVCFAVIFSALCVLSSCNTSPEDKLLGTWKYELYVSGKLVASSTYTFSKSGTEYTAIFTGGSYSGQDTYISSYKVDGNKIVFTLSNGNTISETYSVDGNTLTIGNLKYYKK